MIINLNVKFGLGGKVYIDGDKHKWAYVTAYIYRGGNVEYEVSVATFTGGLVAVYPGEILTFADGNASTNAGPQPFMLEEGKFYRTRDGRKVGPMIIGLWNDKFYDRSKSISSYGWLPNGTFESSLDLVAEWTDPPQEGADGGENRHG